MNFKERIAQVQAQMAEKEPVVVPASNILEAEVIRPRQEKRKKKSKKKKMVDKGIKKLTGQERRALQNYMEQGFTKPRKAVVAAGLPAGTAVARMRALMSRKPILAELEKVGITDEKIANVMADTMEAVMEKNRGFPDHSSRMKAVIEANKIKDNYPAQKVQLDERIITINLTGEDTVMLQKFIDMRNGEGA